MSKVRSALTSGALAVAAVALMPVPASAHFVPAPCDFVTSGGFVFKDDGARVNFGAHGGCKNGAFWGHVNVVDHGGFNGATPYHIDSIEITGYLMDPAFPNARDICGRARTNAGETVRFRVRLEDNGEGANAPAKDRFGIRLSNGYLVSTRPLAADGSGGGNVQLHKPNPSTTGPSPAPSETDMCGDLATPDETPPPPPPPPMD
jgi:hypothetical protein